MDRNDSRVEEEEEEFLATDEESEKSDWDLDAEYEKLGLTRKRKRHKKNKPKSDLILTDESKKLIMDTLKFIHGKDFSLSTPIMVEANEAKHSLVENTRESIEEKVKKLESYGFHTGHCTEALRKANKNMDEALRLLFTNYFDVQYDEETDVSLDVDSLNDELKSLESIYAPMLEEKRNDLWVFRLMLPDLATFVLGDPLPQWTGRRTGRNICRLYAANGKCRFGARCRFSHDLPEETSRHLDVDDKRNVFRLEVRFPKGCNYPNCSPMLLFVADNKLFPSHLSLRITKLLVMQAENYVERGKPFCHELIDFLFNTEAVIQGLGDLGDFEVDPKAPILRNCGKSVKSSRSDEQIPEVSVDSKRSTMVTELVKKMKASKRTKRYEQFQSIRKELPAWSERDRILTALDKNQVLIVEGETGCGKSTQIPQFIMEDWLNFAEKEIKKTGNIIPVNIICTQPRRLAAIGVAKRVAEERGEKIGDIVGYQIRLESRVSSYTILNFCTIGVLMRKIESDPLLASVTHIIIDEVHERSEESDLLLLIAKLLVKTRKTIRIILMSAVVNTELFSSYFDGAPIVSIPGRTFPVTEIYLEDVLEIIGYNVHHDYRRNISSKMQRNLDMLEDGTIQANESDVPHDADETLPTIPFFYRYKNYSIQTKKTLFLMNTEIVHLELVVKVLEWVVNGTHEYPKDGSILIFLPGMAEIRSLCDKLNVHELFSPRAGKFTVIPLHSTISADEQALIFKKTPGKRKVVLSTNIAETSITVDDCVYVIDTGKTKQKRYDTYNDMTSLDSMWISVANAIQRKGRAGRVMPGVCIRLYTKQRYNSVLEKVQIPEVKRTPLDQTIMNIKSLQLFEQMSVHEVLRNLIEPPDDNNIKTGISSLNEVGAMDDEENLTTLGSYLSKLPVNLKLGKLILFGATFGCLDSILTIAAFLSDKNPFLSPFKNRDAAYKKKMQFLTAKSDHLTALAAYKQWHEIYSRNKQNGKKFAERNYLSWKTLENIADVKHNFLDLLISIGFVSNIDIKRQLHEDKVLQATGRQLNENCENNNLLSSIICAALYPNIVQVICPFVPGSRIPENIEPSDFKFLTKNDGYVFLHASSVNFDETNFDSPYLVFQHKMRTNKVYIHECTMVSVLSLVLFAKSDFRIGSDEFDSEKYLILMENGWLRITLDDLDDAKMLQHMRVVLSELIEKKIKNPTMDPLEDDIWKRIISTVVKLTTK